MLPAPEERWYLNTPVPEDRPLQRPTFGALMEGPPPDDYEERTHDDMRYQYRYDREPERGR